MNRRVSLCRKHFHVFSKCGILVVGGVCYEQVADEYLVDCISRNVSILHSRRMKKQQDMTERERKALELWQEFKSMCESNGFEVKTHGCYELFMIDKQQNELIYLDSFTDVTE